MCHSLEIRTSEQDGCIDFIPAANYKDPEYPHRINSFDWFEFYSDLDGKYFIEFLKEKLIASPYDFIFIDTRTGLSEYLGICNIQLPDTNVMVVAPSEQNFSGAKNIIQKILDSPYTKEHRPKPIILPVFSRVDTQHGEKYNEWCEKFLNDFKPVLDQTIFYTNHLMGASERFIENATINYDVDLAYGETVRFKNEHRRIQPGSIEQKFTYIWKYVLLDTKPYSHLPEIEKRNHTQLTLPPKRNSLFVGRDHELDVLVSHFATTDTTTLILSGEAGIGKTSLATQWYYNNLYPSIYTHTGWINCQNGVKNGFLAALTPYFQLEFEPKTPLVTRFEILLKQLLGLKPPCFLVLDSADEVLDLKVHLESIQQLTNFHILVTTRAQALEVNANIYFIPALSETKKLFEHYYRPLMLTEVDSFHNIRKMMGDNTLVMELLAKNLKMVNQFKKRAYTLEQLHFDLKAKGLFGIQSQSVQSSYQSPVLRDAQPSAIIRAMYDLHSLSQECVDLLSIFSVLPSESIPFETINELIWHRQYESKLEDNLAELHQRGLIQFEAGFRMSPIVQQVVRDRANFSFEFAFLVKNLIKKLGTDSLHQENYNNSVLFARYAESVSQYFPSPDPEIDIPLLLEHLGTFYMDSGKLGNVVGFYERSNRLLKLADYSMRFYENRLAISFEKLGDTYILFGNLEKALGFYEASLGLSQEGLATNAHSVEVKILLATSYEKIANIHLSLGNLEKTLMFYEKSIVLLNELYEHDTSIIEIKAKLGISLVKLSETKHLLGEDVNEPIKRCILLLNELSSSQSTNLKFKPRLAIIYENLGNIYTFSGDLNKAMTFYKDCQQLFKELCFNYPMNVNYKKGLATAYQYIGKTYAYLGDFETALMFFKEAINLNQNLFAGNPDNIGFKNGLALSNQLLGSTHTSLKNYHLAVDFSKNALKWSEELYQSYPTHVEFKYSLAVSYSNLGECKSLYGSNEKELEFFSARMDTINFYKKAVQLKAELYASYPSNTKFKDELAFEYYKLGSLYNKPYIKIRGDAEEEDRKLISIYYFKKAEILWQELKQQTAFQYTYEYRKMLQKVRAVLITLEISQISNPLKKMFWWLINWISVPAD